MFTDSQAQTKGAVSNYTPSQAGTSAKVATIPEIAQETDKYLSDILSDLRAVADAICGCEPNDSGLCPEPSGLLYWMQANRTRVGAVGAQVYRIKQALGL